MSAGDIVEFKMNTVVKGLNEPTSYEPTSMFSGTILKTKGKNAIIRFTEHETLDKRFKYSGYQPTQKTKSMAGGTLR